MRGTPGPDSADRYQRVKATLFQSLEVAPEARPQWLDDACGSDLALRAEVEELLAGFETSGGFLRSPAPLPVLPTAKGPPALPERIGGFRILERLGWGAMGVVYLAEQDHPRRRVALKVLRLDCVEPTVRKRFEREALTLAQLSHPGIAQIYEAGVAATESGEQPFFVLEFVSGGTLGEHCKKGQLDGRARITLMLAVCDAVQHAHERGVLHRDLKPDNVLVEATGRPRVVDFGVARLADEARESLRTRTGQLLGTVAYMSPEQLRGAHVDARSDQFGLAAILYELLTGRLPLESRGHTLAEALRSVDHEDPTPPSVYDRELRGDLETVLLKALDPDPARRYVDVAAFAADLSRTLEGRPVAARRSTRIYQLRKLVGRNRLLAGSVAATFVALTIGLGLALAGMREARASERRVLGLSNLRRVEELHRAADELHPFGPALIEPLRAWLSEAEALRTDLVHHRADLKRLRELESEGRLADLDAGAIPGGSAWHLATLGTLVNEIEALLGQGSGTSQLEAVLARLALSETLEMRTLVEPAADWNATIAAIAQPDSPYEGLCLVPQIGLVPLGPDPESGLQEFLVHGTGSVPERDGRTGHLEFEESTGLVLVLVPGGRFWMGVQRQDPEEPHFDPAAGDHEGPPREVALDPFLVGKFEVTQAEWNQLMPVNPSYWAKGKSHNGYEFSLRNPVEHVTHAEASDFARRLACDLPTEAQWEFAARAGVSTFVPCEALCGREHVGCPGIQVGYHVAVGSYPPNAFGLHDTMGNVTEWCRDPYRKGYFESPLRVGDGLLQVEPQGLWSIRGGSFPRWDTALRVGMRYDGLDGNVGVDRGLRVVRSLHGPWSHQAAPRSSRETLPSR